MKKMMVGILCLIATSAFGCATDIPVEEIQSTLDAKNFCILSGGDYQKRDNDTDFYCYCDDVKCAKNVNCSVTQNSNGDTIKECGGVGYTFLTEGLCTMRGVEVCSDRIDKDGVAKGYFTTCTDDNVWSKEQPCLNDYSCQIYLFNNIAMSSKCGECKNNGETCIAGKIQQ